MKFSQNTRVVTPNTINARYTAVTDPNAYGANGKEWDALGSALGVGIKVAQKEQDDSDAADVMEARNQIMGRLSESMYGENGLFTTGVGEKAKGLEGRVTDSVESTFSDVAKHYNQRVQRALRSNLSENMGNFQRMAKRQEGSEFQKVQDANDSSGLEQGTNMMLANYHDADNIQTWENSNQTILLARAKRLGYSGKQLAQAQRAQYTNDIGKAAQAAIQNEDYAEAATMLNKYGKNMNQETVIQLRKQLKEQKDLKDAMNDAKYLVRAYKGNRAAIQAYVDRMRIETVDEVTPGTGGYSGGGDWTGNATYNDLIKKYSAKYGVDPADVATIMKIESSNNPNAVSPVGAIGLMQLMPDTAASLGVDPNTVEGNIEGGVKYWKQMLDTFDGNKELAAAAYNAGPQAVKDAGGVPRFQETQNYVSKFKSTREEMEKKSGGWNVDEAAKGFLGQRMPNGANGCVDAAVRIGNAGGDSFLAQEYNNGVNRVDTLVADAKAANIPVIPFDASKVKAGNLIVYNSPNDTEVHVVVADGKGGYYGNSTGQEKVVHGSDYMEMGPGFYAAEIVQTGGGGGTYTPPKTRKRRKYSDAYMKNLEQSVEAELSDYEKTQKQAEETTVKTFDSEIQNAGSATNALSIYNRYKSDTSISSEMKNKMQNILYFNYPELQPKPESTRSNGNNTSSGEGGSKGDSNALDTFAAELGMGKVTAGTLAAVRRYNRNNLTQEEWYYIHSKGPQGALADAIDENGGDLSATYHTLEQKYDSRLAAQIMATADDDYFK